MLCDENIYTVNKTKRNVKGLENLDIPHSGSTSEKQ
jgi:hypothetical protein